MPDQHQHSPESGGEEIVLLFPSLSKNDNVSNVMARICRDSRYVLMIAASDVSKIKI